MRRGSFEFLKRIRIRKGEKDEVLAEMMYVHLAHTKDAVVAKLNKDYAAVITAYDKGHDHILMMADALADGIVKQFPGKFKK